MGATDRIRTSHRQISTRPVGDSLRLRRMRSQVLHDASEPAARALESALATHRAATVIETLVPRRWIDPSRNPSDTTSPP